MKQREVVINAHARWDSTDLPHTGHWLALAAQGRSFEQIIESRLQANPDEVLTLRAEQDYAKPGMRSVVCTRHRAMAESHPANIDLQYIATRCIDDELRRDQAFEALYSKTPDHGWSAMATAYTYMQQARWNDAVTPLDTARERLASVRDKVALDSARVRRMLNTGGDVQTSDLVPHSSALKYFMAVESGAGM